MTPEQWAAGNEFLADILQPMLGCMLALLLYRLWFGRDKG